MKKSKPRFTVLKQPPGKPWEHTGGGTAFDGSAYPSDDSYEHTKTGRQVTVTCTTEAHFNMPDWVRKPSDLRRLSGVKSVLFVPEQDR